MTTADNALTQTNLRNFSKFMKEKMIGKVIIDNRNFIVNFKIAKKVENINVDNL